MIRTQDLKQQIDDLTRQNDILMAELNVLKRMLQQGSSTNGSQSGQSGNSGQSSQMSGGPTGQNGQQQPAAGMYQAQQDQNQQGQSQQQGQNQQQQSQPQGQGQQQQSQGHSSVSGMASDLSMLKQMVNSLEKKMNTYVSNQSGSNGQLTQQDVVNLMLTIMDGMIDWTSDFVSSQSGSGSGQMQ